MRRLFAATVVLACHAPRAGVDIEDSTASRDPSRKVVVDVLLRAREGLGGNIGTYCVQATFPGEPNPVETCAADLEDGDTKTVRLVSSTAVAVGANIAIRVRFEGRDQGANVVAPP